MRQTELRCKMKKLYLILTLSLAAAGLFAQLGLFGLAYEDDLNTADSLMVQQGFLAREVIGSMVLYTSDFNPLIDLVVLYVDPDTEILHGWSVVYNKDNTPQQDKFILDQMHRMHGESVLVDKDKGSVSWIFDESRSAVYAYSPQGNLRVLYYDFTHAELFAPPSGEQASQDPPPVLE